MKNYKTLVFLFIVTIAILYSASHLNFTFLSTDWFFYCLAWVPLTLLFLSAFKYSRRKRRKERRLAKSRAK